MAERPKFFDDLAGVAGGALSALAGLREEAESMVHAAIDDAMRRLDLVRRSELEAVQEMATHTRALHEASEAAAAARMDEVVSALQAQLQRQAETAAEAAARATAPAYVAGQRLAELEQRVAALEGAQNLGRGPEPLPGGDVG